jgi:hypothetical protein
MSPSIRLPKKSVLVATMLLGVLASSTLLASSARASSLGLYFDYAFGPVDPDAAVLFGTRYDTRRISAGLGVDTAVAKDKLFNYRMNLGYENVRERFQDVEFARFHQGSFENVFGFGVYRSKRMRVWLGPTLRIAAGTLDEDSVPGGGPIGGTVVNLTAGGGLAAGVNVHTGDVGSAAFTIGYQYAYQGRFVTGDSIALPSYLQGRDQRVNFNFAYFFRGKGDRFEE